MQYKLEPDRKLGNKFGKILRGVKNIKKLLYPLGVAFTENFKGEGV